MMKRIWNILNPSNHTLWADWIICNKIKKKQELLADQIGKQLFLDMKKTFELGEELKLRCKMIIGIGECIYLWKDNWHP